MTDRTFTQTAQRIGVAVVLTLGLGCISPVAHTPTAAQAMAAPPPATVQPRIIIIQRPTLRPYQQRDSWGSDWPILRQRRPALEHQPRLRTCTHNGDGIGVYRGTLACR